jgi:hypothetical protein
MQHAQSQHRITQKFALIRRRQFAEGDPVSTTPSGYRFCTREQAIAALPELFNGFPSFESASVRSDGRLGIES